MTTAVSQDAPSPFASGQEQRRTRRFGAAEWFLVIALLCIGGYLALLLWFPGARVIIEGTWKTTEALSKTHGFLGVFLGSLLANATIIIPVPYTILILVTAAAGLSPFLLGIISGVGAGLGELTSYAVGALGYRLGQKHFERNAEILRSLLSRRPWITSFFLFLVGATPIPDDLFMIPLGIIRYNILRALLPFLLGKIVITTAIAYFGAWTTIAPTIETTNIASVLHHGATLAVTVVFVYLVMKVHWDRVGEKLLKSHDGTNVAPKV